MTKKHHKKLVLGITGGIAAYKAAELARLLVKQGHQVRVVMTHSACEFITPLTLQALTGNPVHHALLDPQAELGMGHIELAKWADAIIIAPASANIIARLNAGMADDLLTTVCLASSAPLYLAPAMNCVMWSNPITQHNIHQLRQHLGDKLQIMGPASGEQACGDEGFGRMLEPLEMLEYLTSPMPEPILHGISILISAGPTQEAIDPVRYISNRSSGKMGYSLAEKALELGAKVTLVSGPVALTAPAKATLVAVESAAQMHQAVLEYAPKHDIFISVAAVADYAMLDIADEKIKKQADSLTLTLVKNKDIITDVASQKERPFVVGFAAETQELDKHAKDKLHRKKLDMLVGNLVSATGLGFGAENNSVTVFYGEQQKHFSHRPKTELASALLVEINQQYRQYLTTNNRK